MEVERYLFQIQASTIGYYVEAYQTRTWTLDWKTWEEMKGIHGFSPSVEGNRNVMESKKN